MKTFIISSILFLLFLPWAITHAQPPESFFPYHVGDTWQYTLDNTNIIYDTDIIVADSTDSIGGHYLKYEGDSRYRYHIDTSYNVYGLIPPAQDFYRHFKLDAEIGESWLWVPLQSLDSIRAKVVDIYPSTIFGINTMIKEFEYWMFLSPSDSLWLATRFLAVDFGLIAFWGEPGPFYHLTGALIDSVLYGFIVGIDEPRSQPIFPKTVELFQNYPNPFNPNTTIEYHLNRVAWVVLEIYNSLGQKIRTIINELQTSGNHKMQFDGSQLPSGLYYYRLEADGFTQQKKMLLIK
jgi:Secretion system C-terminal sorting domain